jgi:hypothetical protein
MWTAATTTTPETLAALEKEQARLAANSAQALRALKTRAIAEQTAGKGVFLALQFTATNLILQLKPLPSYDAMHLSVVAEVAQEISRMVLECAHRLGSNS